MKLPREKDDEVWTRIRHHDVEEMWKHSIAPHVAAAYAARMRLLRALVRESAPLGANVIDIGCAQGTLGLMLAEDGYKVSLLDVRAQALEYARERHEKGDVEFITSRAEDLAAAGRNFDVVICTEMIEHVPRPSGLLSILGALIKPRGLLLLTTPNGDYSLSRLPSYGVASQSVIDSAEADSMDGDAHRYAFTREELTSLVRGSGLAVEASGFFLPFWLLGHMKTRYVHRMLFAARQRILEVSTSLVGGTGPVARRTCSGMWMKARKAP